MSFSVQVSHLTFTVNSDEFCGLKMILEQGVLPESKGYLSKNK